MPATQYRFLAVDVDGTLLNSRNELPAANRAALHRAHEADITVCLCTGRCVTETRGVIEQLGLDSDAGVFVFGAIVNRLPSGETLHRTTLPGPLADRLAEHFQSQGYPVLGMYDITETGFDYRWVAGRRSADAYERWTERVPSRVERCESWRPGPPQPLRIGIVEEPDRVAETLAGLEREFGGQIKSNAIYAPNYGLQVVECFAPQVSKWHGISLLLQDMAFDRSQIAAIGDDVNDLEMIREAGLGIAMGNAIGPIKAAAAWHVPRNDEAGVAAAIDALLGGSQRWAKATAPMANDKEG